MKNSGKVILFLALALLAIAAIVLLTKLIGGTVQLLLGAFVVLALLVIVVFMFAYANRRR